MYDYLLGGFHNFEIDRQVTDKFIALYPGLPTTARVNRAYMRRAVEFMIGQGIDQFLDLGSGIPTVSNVHEVARQHNPDARVVYVDIDPIAVAHARAILEGDPLTWSIESDIRNVNRVLQGATASGLIDFSRPLGLLMIAVMHFIPDEREAQATVEAYKAALAPGSYLAIGVWTYDDAPREDMEQYERLLQGTSSPGRPRSRATIEGYLAGLELVPPGLVHSPAWRPESEDDIWFDTPERSLTWVGLGRQNGGRRNGDGQDEMQTSEAW